MKAKDWDKIATNYYSEILSPLKNSCHNPLFEDLRRIKGKNKTVIDLGCGIGELLPELSKKFKEVIAIDYSKKMLETALHRNKRLKKVKYIQADMTNLGRKLHSFADVIISSNSILASNIKDVHKILKEIYKTLKKNGKLLAIVPSTEVYLYEATLIVNREILLGKTEKQARESAVKIINGKEHDFILGKINFNGFQKTFYSFEIPLLFGKAGFKNIKIKKVLYSWKEFKTAGQAYFPGKEKPWDWYITCEK